MKMKVNYSYDFSHVLLFGREEAARMGSERISSEHLLMGLLRDDECMAMKLLRSLYSDIDSTGLIHKIEQAMLEAAAEKEQKPKGQRSRKRSKTTTVNFCGNGFVIDESVTQVFDYCLKEMVYEVVDKGCSTITSVHLLRALLDQPGTIATRMLEEAGIEFGKVANIHGNKTEDSFDFDEDDSDSSVDNSFDKSKRALAPETAASNEKVSSTPFLDKYGVDLTARAAQGQLDKCFGREKEIERIAQILSRKKKNNPILIGYPGVGKTAIVEGLADRIARNEVPLCLFDKRVVSLDMPSMVAGTKYRGQFEERIQGVVAELKENPNIILFIDEIHTIVGAGSASGSMDAANMLKPALSRGELQCIGSTTIDEYRRTIEKDGALERRFQKVMVEPSTPEETLAILHSIKDSYENHHHVNYTDEALEACVRLTERYLTDRQLPDKAIDAMDEAGSRAQIVKVEVPGDIVEAEQMLEDVRGKKTLAVNKQDYELAALLRDEEKQIENQLSDLKAKWEKDMKARNVRIDRHEVEATVSLMSGVPVARMAEQEGTRLKNLKKELLGHVINQDKAVDKLTRAIIRNRMGLCDPNKPIGCFLFLGPTGVGKTYLAKALAEYMFGSADALIRIDMSEYMEKYSTSRLVGAPPGYVGYDEGGQLTEKVRRHPYSIVLLDEIEKANKDVFNLLLQVMDEGRLTDSNGSTVDFKNTIIIITSNTGSRQVQDFGRGIGFGTSDTSPGWQQQNNESIINKALNKQFTPEFLNRLDEIIVFEQLNREAIDKIALLELEKLQSRVKQMGYSFKIDKKGRDFIAEKGFSMQYGARPLKRAIQTCLEDGLSDFILSGKARKGSIISITHRKGEDSLSFSAGK